LAIHIKLLSKFIRW